MNSINMDDAVKYHYDKFPPQNLDYPAFINEFAEATNAIARYDQMLKGLHNSEILLAPMRNQEAVISSRIEGTISTIDEILRYEADQTGAVNDKNHTKDDVIETLLYRRTLLQTQKAIESGYSLSTSTIRTMHQGLLAMGRGASKSPGKFKTNQNFIGDSYKKNILFIPISPEKLDEGLDRLFSYINESQHQPLIKTAISHLEFEALHPFEDGNGRIGRMLITLLLWTQGIISYPHFYISAYFEENKSQYIDIMRDVSEKNDWEGWIRFFMKAIEVQAKRNLEIAEKIKDLYERMKEKFIEELSSKWAVNALDYVFTNPIFRNNRFTTDSGIPPQTARRFSRILSETGLLTTLEEASGQRSALFSFEPLLKLVRV